MAGSGPLSDALKWKYSLYSALIFFIISSPQLYKITQRLLGRFLTISRNGGCPTAAGLVLHTVVFMVALFGLMKLPKDKK